MQNTLKKIRKEVWLSITEMALILKMNYANYLNLEALNECGPQFIHRRLLKLHSRRSKLHSKSEIKEVTKDLYLTLDKVGERRFSLRQICTEIIQQKKIKLSHDTIRDWSIKYGWEKLWNESVQQGITEAIVKTKVSTDESQEEKLKAAIIKAKKNNFIRNERIKTMAYTHILSHPFLSNVEALRAYDIASRAAALDNLETAGEGTEL